MNTPNDIDHDKRRLRAVVRTALRRGTDVHDAIQEHKAREVTRQVPDAVRQGIDQCRRILFDASDQEAERCRRFIQHEGLPDVAANHPTPTDTASRPEKRNRPTGVKVCRCGNPIRGFWRVCRECAGATIQE